MTPATIRRPASPYARRLARERGLALELISGTGPGGRIVAADVAAFVRQETAAPQVAAAANGTTATFTAGVALGPAQALLAGLGKAGAGITLDDLLVRAAAVALEAVLPATHGGSLVVAFETVAANALPVCVTDAHLGLISRLHAQLAEAALEAGPGLPKPDLSLRRLPHGGMRAAAVPLRRSVSLRLVVFAADDAEEGEASLGFDLARIDEDAAAALLARFRDGLEAPLALLA